MFTERCSEKYVKTLIGKTELENALKRLDKLTQEEAWMAAVQSLKVTHSVDERVKGVADVVVTIDNRVASVDGRVASVGNQVSSVDDRVVTVDDRVKVVDNRIIEVTAGM